MKKLVRILLVLLTISSGAAASQDDREQVLLEQDIFKIEILSLDGTKPTPEKNLSQQVEKYRRLSEALYKKGRILKGSVQSLKDSGGAMDGGGGQGIVLKDGRVLFVDTLTTIPSRSEVATPIEKRSILYSRDSVVKNRARSVQNFFSCAKVNLQKQPFEVLRRLSKKVDDLRPLAVEFPIANLSRESLPSELKDVVEAVPLLANTSAAIAEDVQEPVASYQRGRIWISRRMYERMSAFDQCALQVHESLRHLNRIMNLSLPLSTPEIESLTRFIVGTSKKVPQSLHHLEAELLVNDPHAFEALQSELANLRAEVQNLIEEARKVSSVDVQKQLESMSWQLFNTESELNALRVLAKVEQKISSLDQLSAPEAMLLEMRLQEDGLWSAETGRNLK